MFKILKERDENGNIKTHYQLSQGDFCKIFSVPVNPDGDSADTSSVESVIFQLITLSNSIIFEKKLIVDNEGYLLELNSSDTEKINVGNYIYAIKYIFKDKNALTTNKFKFDILEDGRGDLHYE